MAYLTRLFLWLARLSSGGAIRLQSLNGILVLTTERDLSPEEIARLRSTCSGLIKPDGAIKHVLVLEGGLKAYIL